MREIRSYGSVRGVVGNRYPYRDCPKSSLPGIGESQWTLSFFLVRFLNSFFFSTVRPALPIGFVVRRDKPA